MAHSKHQMVILDRSLCQDKYMFEVLSESIKGCLLLANSSSSVQGDRRSVAICVMDMSKLEIRPILTPIIPSNTTLAEIFAGITTLEMSSSTVCATNNTLSTESQEDNPTTKNIDWTKFMFELMPHLSYPPQEGYEVILMVKKDSENDTDLEIDGFMQQPNCVTFKLAQVVSILHKKDDVIAEKPLTVKTIKEGFLKISFPSLRSGFDVFFKAYLLDDTLAPSIPIVIHFSTSIYSKLILSCYARPCALDLSSAMHTLGWTNQDSRLTLETVSRISRNGLCQSLMGTGSPMFIVHSRSGSKYNDDEKMENRLRFQMLLRQLHEEENVLLLQNCTEKMAIKRFFVLIPSLDYQHFWMTQTTPAELLVPESHDISEAVEGLDQETAETIELETKAALRKVPQRDFYDPFEYPCGLSKALDVKKKSSKGKVFVTSNNISHAPSSSSSSRGRGRGRGTVAAAATTKEKKKLFNPICSVTKK